MKLCGIIINHNSTTLTIKSSDNRIHVIATRYEDDHDVKVGDTFKSDYLLYDADRMMYMEVEE